MDGQSTALNESLVARLVVTGVGTLVGVYTVMTLQVRFAIEAL